MRSLAKNSVTGKYRVVFGGHIREAIVEAIEQADLRFAAGEEDSLTFSFEANVVIEITVNHSSDSDLIYRDWERAKYGYIPPRVGPNPKPVLSAGELASDARIEAELRPFKL